MTNDYQNQYAFNYIKLQEYKIKKDYLLALKYATDLKQLIIDNEGNEVNERREYRDKLDNIDKEIRLIRYLYNKNLD